MPILDRKFLKNELPERLAQVREEGKVTPGSLGDRILARRDARSLQRSPSLGEKIDARRAAAPDPEPPQGRGARAFGWDTSRAQADDMPKDQGGRDR